MACVDFSFVHLSFWEDSSSLLALPFSTLLFLSLAAVAALHQHLYA